METSDYYLDEIEHRIAKRILKKYIALLLDFVQIYPCRDTKALTEEFLMLYNAKVQKELTK